MTRRVQKTREGIVSHSADCFCASATPQSRPLPPYQQTTKKKDAGESSELVPIGESATEVTIRVHPWSLLFVNASFSKRA